MNIKINRLIKLISNVVVLVILCMLTLVVLGWFFGKPMNYRLFTVMSGSMEPTIGVGNIVIVKQSSDYGIGDVVTYVPKNDINSVHPKTTTTHRINDIDNEGVITTKGDANDAPDPFPIEREQILGKVVLSIALLGYPIAFAKTQLGLIIMVIIPATILIYSEILVIIAEVKKIATHKKGKKK